MATLGINTKSRSILINCVFNSFPSLINKRPAIDNGLSNQVEQIIPP